MVEFVVKHVKWFLGIGIFMLILGIVLFIVGQDKSFDFIVSGICTTGISIFMILNNKNKKL